MGRKRSNGDQPIGVGLTGKQMRRKKPVNSEYLVNIEPITENQKILFVGHNPIRRAFCSKLMKTIEAQIQKSICSPFSDIPHKIGGLLFLAKIKNTTIDIPRNLIRRDYFRDEDDRTLPKGLSILINDFMPDSTTPFMPYTMAVLRGFPHPYMERYPNVYRPTHTNLTLSSEEITDHLGKIISLISSDDLSTTAIAFENVIPYINEDQRDVVSENLLPRILDRSIKRPDILFDILKILLAYSTEQQVEVMAEFFVPYIEENCPFTHARAVKSFALIMPYVGQLVGDQVIHRLLLQMGTEDIPTKICVEQGFKIMAPSLNEDHISAVYGSLRQQLTSENEQTIKFALKTMDLISPYLPKQNIDHFFPFVTRKVFSGQDEIRQKYINVLKKLLPVLDETQKNNVADPMLQILNNNSEPLRLAAIPILIDLSKYENLQKRKEIFSTILETIQTMSETQEGLSALDKLLIKPQKIKSENL